MSVNQEQVLRYRVVRHTEFDDRAKAEMRINGMDPDNSWTLIWSFDDYTRAMECLRDEQRDWDERYPKVYTTKMVDNGEATTITRHIW